MSLLTLLNFFIFDFAADGSLVRQNTFTKEDASQSETASLKQEHKQFTRARMVGSSIVKQQQEQAARKRSTEQWVPASREQASVSAN